MRWFRAPALDTLMGQLNATFPTRARLSDGAIGDPRHQAEVSDHNPDADGCVCAEDITNGPYWHNPYVSGVDLYSQLKACGDPRIKYVIFWGKIWSPTRGEHNYDGFSPHHEHVHLSVTQSGKNSTAQWHLPMLTGVIPPPTSRKHDDMFLLMKNPHVPAQIWFTNGATKRGIANPTALTGMQLAGINDGFDVTVRDVAPEFFDDIPLQNGETS